MRLVLCDDNRILCEALAVALGGHGHTVLAIATAARDGVAAVAEHHPDVCLLDLRFPGRLDGLGAAETIRQQYPETAVLMLSGFADREAVSAAMRIGVAGFLRKDQDVGHIADALDAIGAGDAVFDPVRLGPVSLSTGRSRHARRLYLLTPREKEVLRRIVAGQSTGQMAGEMNIATSTLRTYVKNVLTKLGAHTRLQAAAQATREDLVSDVSSA